jgi:hypothetical protein
VVLGIHISKQVLKNGLCPYIIVSTSQLLTCQKAFKNTTIDKKLQNETKWHAKELPSLSNSISQFPSMAFQPLKLPPLRFMLALTKPI